MKINSSNKKFQINSIKYPNRKRNLTYSNYYRSTKSRNHLAQATSSNTAGPLPYCSNSVLQASFFDQSLIPYHFELLPLFLFRETEIIELLSKKKEKNKQKLFFSKGWKQKVSHQKVRNLEFSAKRPLLTDFFFDSLFNLLLFRLYTCCIGPLQLVERLMLQAKLASRFRTTHRSIHLRGGT